MCCCCCSLTHPSIPAYGPCMRLWPCLHPHLNSPDSISREPRVATRDSVEGRARTASRQAARPRPRAARGPPSSGRGRIERAPPHGVEQDERARRGARTYRPCTDACAYVHVCRSTHARPQCHVVDSKMHTYMQNVQKRVYLGVKQMYV